MFSVQLVSHMEETMSYLYTALFLFIQLGKTHLFPKDIAQNITVVHIYIMKLLKTLGYRALLPPNDI